VQGAPPQSLRDPRAAKALLNDLELAMFLQKRQREPRMREPSRALLEPTALQSLFGLLQADGYTVVGPRLRGGALCLEPLRSAADLPRGFSDVQEPGRYRLDDRGDGTLFSWAVGPQSAKRYLHPAEITLFRIRRDDGAMTFETAGDEPPRLAFFGLRPCDVAAMAVQDRVLRRGPYADPVYAARREGCFVVAANCVRPGGTCFCASLGTGPRAEKGFDLALTELAGDGAGESLLLAEAGSGPGEAVLARLPQRPADEAHLAAARSRLEAAASAMGRTLQVEGLKERLYARHEDPAWDAVGARCLACGNCTQVCPTCFCTSTSDATDLTGGVAERRRHADSCFSLDFSYIHGGSVRTSPGARYRQWITHKLATWVDQFGEPGCVGCGRCITWCPVGIDITAEAAAPGPSRAAGR
jgi:ferredoxin